MESTQWTTVTDGIEATCSLFSSIKETVENDLKNIRSLEASDVEDKMRQLNSLLLRMELDSDGKSETKRKIDDLRSSFRDLEHRVVKYTGPLIYPIDPVEEPSYAHRLSKTMDSIEKQGTGWKNAKEQLQHTETIGEDILNNLSRQRETVILAGSIANDSNTLLNKGNRLIRTMRRKIARNKTFWWCSIWLTGFVLLTTLYLRVFYHRK